MSLSEELKWRGFVNQTTLNKLEDLDNKKMSFYFGVDPSSDSMTIGNLASAMMVSHFIDNGHKAYLLVGGATGLIGDPDGKSEERNLISTEQIEHNKKNIADQYRQIFAGKDFTVVDNYDWFKDMGYLNFLREVGKHAPMGVMLGRDFIQKRLGEGGSGISYAEFSYSLIQGYDFLHLFRTYNVTLQLCGADQWGNSIAGVDLIRRIESSEAHVLSTPLIVNKSTGKKFGKTEEGAIWLDSNKTSVYKFYQFWLNADDAGVIEYMKVYTKLSQGEIIECENLHKEHPENREAQKRLAYEVTKIVHGEERAKSAQKVTAVLFGGASFETLSASDIEILAQEIPNVKIGIDIYDALVDSKIASSKSDARRLVESGAISVNSSKIDKNQTLDKSCLVKKGKNNFILGH